jgi:prepilin-type N-terminal cleavage/methylation domain-containing protein
MKTQLGFSLVEVMVSLMIFAVAVLGFLQLNTKSQHLMNESLLQQQVVSAIAQAKENLSQPLTKCPACLALVQLKQQFSLQSKLKFKQQDKRTIVVTYCQTENTCQNNNITV